MTTPPTPRQLEFLAFISVYTHILGRPPSEAEMQKFLKLTPPSVHHMILRLEKRGFITRQPGQPRSIRLAASLDVPLLGGRGTPQRKRIKPSDKLPLAFSKREQCLLLNEVWPPTALENRIRLSIADHSRLVARFTLAEFEELAGYVAAQANHTKSRKVQKDLDHLFSRIQKVLDTHTDEDE
ncbi:MAG: MarR family transcriptional regulator [Nitrospira sp.]|nr:MAG: MarR family transcriptional regulator [Nitrospira sp.]